jgi:hypothetical protein
MSLDKTITDIYRRDLGFEEYEVFGALPSHFDDKYPNLVKFLQEYYRNAEQEDSPVNDIKKRLVSRDIVQTKAEFLTFIASELLLGKPYFETFNDKRSALQYSNLLYRSKGTEFSIKQFFRIFYDVDIEVTYGRESVFNIGEVNQETLEYLGDGPRSGNTFDFTFPNSQVIVSIEDSSGEFRQMTEGKDYSVDFANQVVHTTVADSSIDPNDASLTYLATTGFLPSGQSLRIVSNRSVHTTIGSDVTDKKITDNQFYQLYGLLIATPISVSIWRDAYKTFVHPAGMFLSGQVEISSVFDLGLGIMPPAFIQPPPPLLIEQQANLMVKQSTKGLMTTNVTEIGPGPNGYRVVSRPNDAMHPRHIEKWHLQYGSMADADDINSRTLDDTYADLSNVINTLDEGLWHSDYLHPIDSDGSGNRTPIWGYNEANVVQYDSDFPHGPEYTV